MSTHDAVDLAVSMEAAGFETAWFTEIEREPFVRCAAAISRTTRLRVGTGVALWTRSPVTMAMTAAELHELSNGRFTLGVGSGTAYANENVHNINFDRPVARMAEYVDVVRGAWNSRDTPYDFEGDHFTVRGYGQPYFESRPPLLLAAVGERMLRLAAREADGVILNPSTTPWYLSTHVLPQLMAGASQKGRSLSGFHRALCLRCSVDSDRFSARERARLGIVEYGRYPVHQAQYSLYGFGREAAAISAAMAKGDTAAAVASVGDDMVDTLGIAGTPDDVRRALGKWENIVDSVALMSPTFGLTTDEVRTNCSSIVETFTS
jgi:alkanesulfonate monooxygenase SsuD/methylene tetrahydromethanopterin reductase-like flavin-dependent oxidoreductase (luciferase family)